MNEIPKPKRRKGPKLTGLAMVAEQAQAYGIQPLPELKGLDRFLTPNQAGRLLNVTGEAVKQWIYHGRLPATKLSNGYWMIRAGDLDAFIRARQEYDRKRVLLFCSVEKDVGVLEKVLAECGHEPVVAHNVTDGVLKTADLKPSAFIIDAGCEAGQGWRLLEKVRKMSHARRISVMLLAAKALTEAEEELALDLQVQCILRSPVVEAEVKNELERVLETARH